MSEAISDFMRRLTRQMRAARLADRSDLQLVQQVLAGENQAFEAIVCRHGAMVYRLCWRVLRQTQDAEDAFQATFLILAQRLRSVRKQCSLASWLHAVAHRAALRVKTQSTARRQREARVISPASKPSADLTWSELQSTLDAELCGLPEKLRSPLILCYLEGRTQDEAARQLGWSKSTLRRRLEEARDVLGQRLTAQNVAWSAALSALLVSDSIAAAAPAPALVTSTVEAAAGVIAGSTVAKAASAKVAALTEGASTAMMIGRLKAALAILLVLGFVITGATVLSYRTAAAQLRGGEISREQPMPDLSGTWQGDGWGTVVLRPAKAGEFAGTYTDTFGTDTGRISVRWTPVSGRFEGTWGEGKFRFGRIALEAVKDGNVVSGAWTTDPNCEHQPGVPGLASLRWTRAKPAARQGEGDDKKPDQKGFTAWGNEVGGLQAGLGFRPGDKRAYRPGDTVRLVVRVRNVGKERVNISYFPQFFIETLPAVTDGKGKSVPLRRSDAGEFVDGPVAATLAPGQEVELYELKLDARSGAQSVNDKHRTLFGTGKFQIEYQRVMYSSGKLDIDPILGKLATGKLELEIKFNAPPAASGQETPPKSDREESTMKPIKIRVYIEKVNEETSTIAASCMLIGALDNVTKPARLENLRVAEKAKITDRGKEIKLTDLKLLPRDTHFYLFLRTYEEEFGFEVVGIETIRE
jgi:RNA polymerase sigma factor (sigma-70 family)